MLAKVLENIVISPVFWLNPFRGKQKLCAMEDYLKTAKALREEHNVLFVADEVQTGIARTGRLLATCGTEL